MNAEEGAVVPQLAASQPGLAALVGLVLRLDGEVRHELLEPHVLKLHKRPTVVGAKNSSGNNTHQPLAFSPSGS